VLRPNSADREFWEDWVARNPERAELVRLAKAMIHALQSDRPKRDYSEIDEAVSAALSRLQYAPRYVPIDGPVRRRSRLAGLLLSPRTALPVILLVGVCVAGFIYFRALTRRDVLQSFLGSHRKAGIREWKADQSGQQDVRLPDGSMVRLGRSSKLYYSVSWERNPALREVYVDGEAYFEVSSEPRSPFYVYSSRLIARAADACFLVHAFSGEEKASFTVLSGSLSVFRQEDYYNHPLDAWTGIELTRNQAAVDDRLEDRIRKTIALAPVPAGDRPDTGFVFCGTPLPKVFSQLEACYGIPIQYGGHALDSCHLTATLDNRSFSAKMNAICKAIGASWQQIDGNVVVLAPGCR